MATLTAGTKLGMFEIVGPIGAGGMGTVYRARDTRLPRDAAIKVSAEQFTERFAREAHAIASLNHPNITTLYDVGPDYLVMELVEGPTLADRLAQGPLSLDEAAGIARQIAEALDYAHERGIVHRDLKPGNVKIRPDGVVKVLDFGLAKAGMAGSASQSDQSPTMTAHQTEAGMIVGTAAYMAPEQVKGQAVDKRADVWAFGCVFYEMLTGASVYRGDSTQETMARVLRDEPDLSKVPVQARRLLKRCLEKDPQKRQRHIGDVMALLDEPPSGEHAAPVVSETRTRGGKSRWPAVAAAAVVLLAGAGLIVLAPWRSQTGSSQAVRFEVGETDKLRFFYGAAMAVSPDGRWMVFPATGEDGVARYWLRSLDTVEVRPLPGTETAYVPAAWAADSRTVIFTTLNAPSVLKKVDIQGGPPQTISTIRGQLNGASQNRDGVILFGSSATQVPIFRVSSTGEAPIPLTALADGETAHRFPQILPDGRRFLYFRAATDPSRAGIYVGAIDAKPEAQSSMRILATNREAYYAPSPNGAPGHLLFLRDATLMAQTFSPDRLELSGEAVPVAEGVDSFTAVSYGMFAVSDTGTLVYRGGAGAKIMLTWFDANGRPADSLEAGGDYSNPSISLDGTRIAVAMGPLGSKDIWMVDVARRTTTRLTFDPADDDNPVWSPDGRGVAFSSNRGGTRKLYLKPADGSADERLLTDQPGIPTSWSRDGRFLLFTSTSPTTRADLWVLPNPGQPASKPYPFLATASNEQAAQFSPDGRWIAYSTDESSPSDVYVRQFSPGEKASGNAKWLVSSRIAVLPRWSADGRQVIYLNASGFEMEAVDVDTSKGFQAANPRRLFPAPPPLVNVGWTLSPNDKRFLFVTTPNGGRTAPFTIVLNWAAALKK